MTFRCVLIDDERPARDKLRRLLARHPDFEIVGEADDGTSAIRLIDEQEPDLCFLDVRMPEADGFEVLRGVRKVPAVIFTTAYDHYAVRAFDVHSIDYLLKPLSRKRFDEALERARSKLATGAESPAILEALERIRDRLESHDAPDAGGAVAAAPITGRKGQRIVILRPGDVMWFEADDTLVFACASRGRFLVDRTLADLERDLGPAFFRAHRRYLVNLSAVEEIDPEDGGHYRLVMRDPARSVVPLSRRQARRLRELLPW